MLTFDDLNFRFRSPDRPWVAYDASRVNKASKLAFMRRNPEAYFFIIAEKLGSRSGLDTEQLAGIGKANLQAAAASSHVVSGLLVEAEAQIGAYQIHYRHWYCFTNGYAYQLVGFSSSDEQQRMAGELQEMLSRFELIDPNRVASFSNGFTTNYYSARHHFMVMLTNSAWHVFPSLDLKMPLAEIGVSQGDSCLVVVPASQPFFQARASLVDQAVTNYASLFATGYRSMFWWPPPLASKPCRRNLWTSNWIRVL